MPIVYFGDVALNVGGMIAFESADYEAGKEGRAFSILMITGDRYTFKDTEADQAAMWFLQVTGRAKVQG